MIYLHLDPALYIYQRVWAALVSRTNIEYAFICIYILYYTPECTKLYHAVRIHISIYDKSSLINVHNES